MLLIVNSVFHFLVDAVSICTLFSGEQDTNFLLYGVIIYNTLAFSTQCLFGAFFNNLRRLKCFEIISIIIIGIGNLLPLPYIFKIIVIGLGNSLFHVTSGCIIICNNSQKAFDMGAFVSTGAIGVTFAYCFPTFGTLLSVVLLVLALYYYCFVQISIELPIHQSSLSFSKVTICDIILLIFAVASRAFGSSVVSFSWKKSVLDSFLLTFFVFSGKFCGGFLFDHFHAKVMAIASLPLSAILIAFFPDSMLLSLVGQFLLNLTMPVTLWLLFKKMPSKPALAFGLTASALWPGTIAGQLLSVSSQLIPLIIIVSLGISFLAILISSSRNCEIKENSI